MTTDISTATSTSSEAALEFASDDNVPRGLLRWMKAQKSPPACVTMGSNATYCAIGTGDYLLRSLKKLDRVKISAEFLAKTNQTLNGVVSLPLTTATETTSLRYGQRN